VAGWLGRWTLPLLWFSLAVFALASGFLGGRSSDIRPPTFGEHTTYYVVAHNHYALSLAAAFGIFAVAYAVLVGVFNLPHHWWLGYIHLALMVVGAGMVLAPQYLLRLGLPRRGVGADPIAVFAELNRLSMAGYLMMMLGLLVFVVVLLDTAWGVWRRASH
jgi:heme/copper-type cytochrome/quinol oxidase subunit 1